MLRIAEFSGGFQHHSFFFPMLEALGEFFSLFTVKT